MDFEINENIVKNYVNAINHLTQPMSIIKEWLKKLTMDKNVNSDKKIPFDKLKDIINMSKSIENIVKNYPNNRIEINICIIKSIMEENNGVITTRMIEPLNISRQYISMLEKNKEIERIDRGIYISINVFQDDFYTFQQRYRKTIFSHMTALYLFGLTEEIPYDFMFTVPNGYHIDFKNHNCKPFYVSEDIYNLGVCEIKTPNGNTVRTYDMERCICDIIRSKNRLDFEQVKKSVRLYVKRKDKNLANLSKYAEKMNISEEVMSFVGMFYE